MSKRDHWESVYRRKESTNVSWYQPHLERSLELIESAGIDADAKIIDVGGGASTLVDDLLSRGFKEVTVVDLAQSALDQARERLGPSCEKVQWIVGDITQVELPRGAYDLWHDRAVFHFLTQTSERQAYLDTVCSAVKPGGHVLLATFGPRGPEKCSGLDVVRYSAAQLHDVFGEPFHLVTHLEERHETPWGAEQEFVYCLCLKD